MANWIVCTPLESRDMVFVNLDNVVAILGNNLGSSIVHAGGEFVVADRPEELMAKRSGS